MEGGSVVPEPELLILAIHTACKHTLVFFVLFCFVLFFYLSPVEREMLPGDKTLDSTSSCKWLKFQSAWRQKVIYVLMEERGSC